MLEKLPTMRKLKLVCSNGNNCTAESKDRMRLILMGTGPFAVPTFHSLTQSSHEIAAVVTRRCRRHGAPERAG